MVDFFFLLLFLFGIAIFLRMDWIYYLIYVVGGVWLFSHWWVRMIMVPYHFLYPMIIVFCAIGVFSLSNNAFDLQIMVGFGLLGYILKKLDCEPAPLLLGFILGPLMEEFLRRSLLLSQGDPTVFVTRPLSAVLLALAVAVLAMVLLPTFSRTRDVAFKEA